MIVPVRFVGRGGNVDQIAPAMFWVDEWGVLDEGSLATKLSIREEVQEVDTLRREKDILQRQIADQEARAAAQKKVQKAAEAIEKSDYAQELKIEDNVEFTKE
jgi:hypothetical protein